MTGISISPLTLATANQASQWSASRAVVSNFKAAWQQGDRPDALTFLARYPEPAFARSTVLDLAYEEFCLRTEQGETIQPDEFAAQFPAIQQSLTRLLTVHRFLMANPQLAESGTPREWPALGDEFLGFELIEELGRGAFARVFLASELALSRRQVVAKIGSQGAGEAEIIAKLRHPYIVPIHSVRVDPDTGWSLICMPYQGRATLCDVVDSIRTAGIPLDAAGLKAIFQSAGELGPAASDTNSPTAAPLQSYIDAVLAIGRKIAEALGYAHGQGICHQDLKPSNVLLTYSGDPVLLDFNLSSDGRPADRIGGTLPYMAPEQIEAMLTWHSESRLAFSPASDVFAWGVLMFELLSGRQPFRSIAADSPQLWTGLHDSRREPVDFASLNGRIPPSLVELLHSCLAFEIARRPKSARQLIDVLDQIAIPDATPQVRSLRRGKLLRFALPAIVILGLAGAYASSSRAPASVSQLMAAQVAFEREHYDESIEHLNRALDADPSLVEAMVLRGRVHEALGRFNTAFIDYSSAYKLTHSARFQACRGYCLAKENSSQAAVRCFELAIADGYRTAEVYNDMGFSLARLGRTKEAIESLNSAIAIDQNMQAALVNRAASELNMALATGDPLPLRVLQDITRAIELGPPSGDVFLQAASICSLAAKAEPQYAATGLGFLRQAILYGSDKKLMDANPLFAEFRKNPAYQELSALKPLPAALKQAEHLVSPL